MRLTAAIFVIGNDLLRAGFDDIDFDIPDRAVRRDLQLKNGVAIAGILAML